MQKHIYFNGQKLTLYSLDGLTWSSRKSELPQIKERQNALKDKIRSNFNEPLAEDVSENGETKDETKDDSKELKVKASKKNKPVPKKRETQSPKKNKNKKSGKRVA